MLSPVDQSKVYYQYLISIQTITNYLYKIKMIDNIFVYANKKLFDGVAQSKLNFNLQNIAILTH